MSIVDEGQLAWLESQDEELDQIEKKILTNKPLSRKEKNRLSVVFANYKEYRNKEYGF